MTARELYIAIESELKEAKALCDMVSGAASCEGLALDTESVSRTMAIVLTDLQRVIRICEEHTKEREGQEE